MTATPQTQLYRNLLFQLRSLLETERDSLANTANFAAVLYHGLPQINWVGFYRLTGRALVLGAFQGKPACVRIAWGKGVCGTAVAQRKTLRVPDVHAFAGHIACDSASKSELVIPVFKKGSLWGVLDIDSPVPNRFDETDQENLEQAVRLLEANTDL